MLQAADVNGFEERKEVKTKTASAEDTFCFLNPTPLREKTKVEIEIILCKIRQL